MLTGPHEWGGAVTRQPGIHAAGIVIAQSDVTDFCPVSLAGKNKDLLCTQLEMGWVGVYYQ